MGMPAAVIAVPAAEAFGAASDASLGGVEKLSIGPLRRAKA